MSAWYDNYLRSAHWKAMRLRKLMTCEHNDEFMCIRCEGCKLWIPLSCIQIHHDTYDRIGCEELDDLKALCDGCHCKEHGIAPPLWHDEAIANGNLMVTEQTIKHNQHLRKIGSVVIKCLDFCDRKPPPPSSADEFGLNLKTVN